MIQNRRSGSLVLCIPADSPIRNERLEIIGSAVRQAARELGSRIESIRSQNLLSVGVMFRYQNNERWVYSDWNKEWDKDLIYRTIRNFAWALQLETTQISSAGNQKIRM
jgi:hypothetical protein